MVKIFSHFGVHNTETGQPIAMNSNAGDTLLFQATRDLFSKSLGPIEWKFESLWEKVTTQKISALNERSSAIVIGGGGLFLRDQVGADPSTSGWQWNCSTDMVQRLDVPLIVFGVGYNRFRNQSDFDSAFAEQISAVVDKSVFFGLRNHGSMYAIRRYLPSSLHHRVKYQPCPTTVAWHLYKDTLHTHKRHSTGRTLVLNTAFDRREMRFGMGEKDLLPQIARAIKIFADDGWNIVLANHKPQDAEIAPFLQKIGVSFRSTDLSQCYPEDVLEFYAESDVTVGMRGHAQMIPFGLRKRIVSIVSHDKMGWFLDDIGHPEWGVDVEEPEFESKLANAIRHVMENQNVQNEIVAAQERLWDITNRNMQEIASRLG